ncbi:hypothetical protein ACQR1Y_24325 [Bradyrhizobium sp. HKCCYLRH3099]|uniref:hypothetical protein n=1 Tax=unclassified Bradyrhizobium TaxID=2631580 RepID=UPI003EBEC0C3
MVKSRRALAALISVSALFGPFVAHSQTLTRLHAFTGSGDGLKPWSLLSAGGKLFGTTPAGGAASSTMARVTHARCDASRSTVLQDAICKATISDRYRQLSSTSWTRVFFSVARTRRSRDPVVRMAACRDE